MLDRTAWLASAHKKRYQVYFWPALSKIGGILNLILSLVVYVIMFTFSVLKGYLWFTKTTLVSLRSSANTLVWWAVCCCIIRLCHSLTGYCGVEHQTKSSHPLEWARAGEDALVPHGMAVHAAAVVQAWWLRYKSFLFWL